jgi:hypothetical protein
MLLFLAGVPLASTNKLPSAISPSNVKVFFMEAHLLSFTNIDYRILLAFFVAEIIHEFYQQITISH